MSINKDSEKIIAFLASVLEDYGTAEVLTSPSTADRSEVLQAVKSIDPDPIVRDLTTLVVDTVADTLHSMALRPADYADMKELPSIVLALITKTLSSDEGRKMFEESFQTKLRSRG